MDDDESSFANTMEQGTGCSPVVSVPKDKTVTYNEDKPAQLINHGKGVLACGGVDTADTYHKTCKYWQPGMATWEDRAEMKANHDVGKRKQVLSRLIRYLI